MHLPGSRRLQLFFWAAAIFAFVMATLPHPPRLPGDPSDKLQHIIAFATLGALGALAYPRTRLARLAVLLSLFGGLIEIVQAIPALNRDSDIIDWIADTVASAVALLLIRRWWLRSPLD